jgi:hypothetical protein
MALPRGASRFGIRLLVGVLAVLTLTGATGEGVPSFVWMGQVTEGNALFVYGAQDSPEDMLFWIECNSKKKSTEMTLYEDIPGVKVGDPITLGLAGGAGKVTLKGKVTTDEMSGFHYAVAKSFKVKPVLELFKAKGQVMARAGKLTSALPDKGRPEALAKFAKGCPLD